jgi:hypothetical protein
MVAAGASGAFFHMLLEIYDLLFGGLAVNYCLQQFGAGT